ncbi:MAG: hypothetical protein ACRDJE_15585 [Dehalococcoidia bacterium]
MTTKQLVLKAIENLPDEADIDDVIERILFLHTLQERLDRADDEPTFTQEEIERQMAEWQE